MRPIKFLGKRTDIDEFIIGEAVDLGGNSIGCWVRVYGDWELRWYPVEPESIAQFVGYDKDGREVYEGDILVDKEGNGFTARLVCRVLDDEGFLLDIPLEYCKLKEEPKP